MADEILYRARAREQLRYDWTIAIRNNLLNRKWDISSDEGFKAFLLCGYESVKRAIQDLTENEIPLADVLDQMPDIVGKMKYERLPRDLSAQEIQAYFLRYVRSALYLYALGLFEFGRLDVVYDILDNIPEKKVRPDRPDLLRQQVCWLIRFIHVPQGRNPLHDPEPMRKWLQRNFAHLIWNEEQLRYDWVG